MYRPLLTACVLIVATVCTLSVSADPPQAVGQWDFDGDLRDRSGCGNDAFLQTATFTDGHTGQGLKCDQRVAVVPDCCDLRPEPGLQIECWAKIDKLGKSWQPLVMKEREYQLRIDPPSEGGHFSFFLHLDGWEPRVRSEAVAKEGIWHHLVAGWDGKEIWLEVDGQRTSRPRSGVATPSHQPLELGDFDGVLDDVRIENPNARYTGAALWRFDGDTRDASEHGYHLTAKDPEFVRVPGGQALKSTSAVKAPNVPDLQVAPGMRIDCSVYFEEPPKDSQRIVFKEGEYQLRVNPASEGGMFAFFVNLGGWEPRVNSTERVVPGKWYRVTAQWSGTDLTLDVNGERKRVTRSGIPQATDNPLVVGGGGVWIDNLAIENPRLPTLQVRDVRQEHAILCAGRPEKLTVSLRNIGMEARQTAVRLELPPGVRCQGDGVNELGTMPMGAERSVECVVLADRPQVGAVGIRVTADDTPAVVHRHPLVFFESEDSLPPLAVKVMEAAREPSEPATTYYVDSEQGNNANAGTSPESAWKDFTNVNGRTLGPGERLLIRRGSVLNQELSVSARGTAARWAEIGTYGAGPRPIIRRNWDIDDRCVLVRDPDFLRIRGLTVCYAGKGLIVSYTQSGHEGLLIEDCIAHHIEGLYRFNAHGIPEWLDRRGAPGDGLHTSAGIGLAGASAKGLVVRDCEVFQCSSGWFVRGDDALVDRVFCHDNYAHNTSPHPFLVSIRRTVLQNSIFDASGWHASAGTMGIMLGGPQGLIIRNCVFRNQPDSGSHDEGGIDYEAGGNGSLIDHCTFENNAGAAIEVLGLRSPQTTNIEIRGSQFIRNNVATKLGPSEIFVWGRTPDPAVCCSTGTVQGNGYITRPGIEFFVNEAPTLTSWTLRDNTQYGSVEELQKAMRFNRPPVVEAGEPIRTDSLTVALGASADDDGLPEGKKLRIAWEVLEGAGKVSFADATSPRTTATFENPGDYLLRLVADDGEFWHSDLVAVHILPEGTSSIAAWEFNTPLDKEGWTEVNPGTEIQKWPNQNWPTTSHPVKIVAGGYYVVAIKNSSDAHLLSPNGLGIGLTGKETVILRLQNHTPATQMRLQFTTEADTTWDDAKSLSFGVVANDKGSRTYEVDMSSVPGWKGRLKQIRLDLATGEPLTGTCRLDYMWIAKPAR